MLYRCTAVVAACVVAACGADSVGTLVPFTHYDESGYTAGTAADDLWSLTSYGKMGQDDPFEMHLELWDGASVHAVPFSDEVFKEGACGLPSSVAAVSRGEIWLASIHVPNCGITQAPTYEKVIFGKLKSDGTWEDHSADFPTSAPGTYKAIELAGRDGVLWVSINGGALYRYAADGSRAQIPLPPGASARVTAISADEVIGGSYLYYNGSWQLMPQTTFNVAANHINTGGERWSYGGLRDQETTTTVYKYAAGMFTEVPVMTSASEPFTNQFVTLTLVPHGGGTFAWYFVDRSVKYGGLTIQKREFDGTTLGGSETISEAGACSGTSEQCLARDARVSLLADGSAVVGHDGNLFRYVVSVDDL